MDWRMILDYFQKKIDAPIFNVLHNMFVIVTYMGDCVSIILHWKTTTRILTTPFPNSYLRPK